MSGPKILAWKFTKLDGRGSYGDLPFEPGYVYSTDEPKIVPCKSGIHGSVDPFDALKYAPGPVLCRVRLWGDVKENGSPVDKVAARHCEVLWTHDATKDLRLFAIWCARQVEHLLTDPRSKAALDTAERHAHGKATDQELSAAWNAAWAARAAGAAAWAAGDAAGDAAWNAVMAAQRGEFCRVCAEIERRHGEGKP